MLTGTFASQAQPVIKTWGSSNPALLVKRTERFLHHLDIHDQVEIVVSVHTGPPGLLKGMTIPYYTSDSTKFTKFKVIIDGNVSAMRRAVVLAHELIHVRQYVTRQLIRVKEQDVKWGDKIYTYQYTLSHRSPWEKEAHRLDRTLALLVRDYDDRTGDKQAVSRRYTRHVAEWNRLATQSNSRLSTADARTVIADGKR